MTMKLGRVKEQEVIDNETQLRAELTEHKLESRLTALKL